MRKLEQIYLETILSQKLGEGDLNFSIVEAEVWGDKGRVDKLIKYFVLKISMGVLFNIELVKLRPTW